MRHVHQAMHPRRQDDPHDSNKDDAAEERVDRGEELPRGSVHAIDGAHAAEDHCRVEKRVEPAETSRHVVTQGPDADRDRHDRRAPQEMAPGAPQEPRPGEQAVLSVFVHSPSSYGTVVALASRRTMSAYSGRNQPCAMSSFRRRSTFAA